MRWNNNNLAALSPTLWRKWMSCRYVCLYVCMCNDGWKLIVTDYFLLKVELNFYVCVCKYFCTYTYIHKSVEIISNLFINNNWYKFDAKSCANISKHCKIENNPINTQITSSNLLLYYFRFKKKPILIWYFLVAVYFKYIIFELYRQKKF